jgi:hypothetical protein
MKQHCVKQDNGAGPRIDLMLMLENVFGRRKRFHLMRCWKEECLACLCREFVDIVQSADRERARADKMLVIQIAVPGQLIMSL